MGSYSDKTKPSKAGAYFGRGEVKNETHHRHSSFGARVIVLASTQTQWSSRSEVPSSGGGGGILRHLEIAQTVKFQMKTAF
jgi:hypothetical protein